MLIIVNGQPATGKTSIARHLADRFNLEHFLKDTYKETAYGELGSVPSLRQWLCIEQASWEAMYQTIEQALEQHTALLIEGDFTRRQKRRLTKYAGRTDILEIYCYASPRVVLSRFRTRLRTGNRHASHRDKLWLPFVFLETAAASLGWRRVKPLRLSEAVLMVDTSDFSIVDFGRIRRFVQAHSHCRPTKQPKQSRP